MNKRIASLAAATGSPHGGPPHRGPPPRRPTASTTNWRTSPPRRGHPDPAPGVEWPPRWRPSTPPGSTPSEAITRAVLASTPGRSRCLAPGRWSSWWTRCSATHMELVNYVPSFDAGHHGTRRRLTWSKAPRLDACSIRRWPSAPGSRRRAHPATGSGREGPGPTRRLLASPVEKDPFLSIRPPADMDEAAVANGGRTCRNRWCTFVRPALALLPSMIAAEVLPAARPPEHSGVCWLPRCGDLPAAIHQLVSLDLDPREIHQIGLDASRPLPTSTGSWAAGRWAPSTWPRSTGACGGPGAALHHLRGDQGAGGAHSGPRCRRHARLVRQAAPDPVHPARGAGGRCGRRPLAFYLPPASDGSRPGLFFINTTEPTTRARYESEALAFHESVPGHHFQLALAQEMEDLPTFRRHAIATAYCEGWGLYCEAAGRRDGPQFGRPGAHGDAVLRLLAFRPPGGGHRHPPPRPGADSKPSTTW